jgi:hypothetical protein
MARPTLVTITGTLLRPDGTPDAGRISFYSPVLVRDSVTDDTMTPGLISDALDVSGNVSITVPATTDPAWSPSAWTYAVTMDLASGRRVFAASVPHGSPTLEFSDLLPAQPSGGTLYAAYGHVHTLQPSGDLTGATDTAALNASLIANAKTTLAAGTWYVSDVGMITNNRWLQGSGPATVLTVVPGHSALVLTGPGDVHVSDMTISGGNYGIIVNGCYDGQFENLRFTGQALGGVKVNGDLATEQHWTDITMRGVGGIAFAIDRTTSIYTGSLYLDRVRIVEPAPGATHGFRFRSVAGSPSLNIAFMTQCVADNYSGDGLAVLNCGQVFVTNGWFAINASAPSGAAALRITDGFQQSYTGCYTYSGRNDPTVVVSGNTRGVNVGGHTFDGTPTTVALGLSGSTASGFTLGDYQNYCGAGLVDVPAKLVIPQPSLPGTTAKPGEESFSRMLVNNVYPMVSGTLVLTVFTSTKTELISTIEAMTNDAAAGGTYRGYGLFTLSDADLLTLVAKAEQTSGFTLWGSAFQPIGGFDTKLGLSAVYSKLAGPRYAIGALYVGPTPPKLLSNIQSNGTPQSSLPVTNTPLGLLSATKTGQTTLGALGTTHTLASLSGSGHAPYFVVR